MLQKVLGTHTPFLVIISLFSQVLLYLVDREREGREATGKDRKGWRGRETGRREGCQMWKELRRKGRNRGEKKDEMLKDRLTRQRE